MHVVIRRYIDMHTSKKKNKNMIPPFLKQLETSKGPVLLCGAGGGYDCFTSLSIYKTLTEDYKRSNVFIASYSFSDDLDTYPQYHESTPFIVSVTPETKRTVKNGTYFPEHDLAVHLNAPVLAIRLVSPRTLFSNLQALCNVLNIQTIIATDAGFDGLLFGDEIEESYDQANNFKPIFHYGSPLEDMSMAISLYGLFEKGHVSTIWWMCTSVPTEDIPFSYFYKHTAELTKRGYFLGAVSQHPAMKDELEQLLNKASSDQRSIPNESLLASFQGHVHDQHFVNPRLFDRIDPNDETCFPPVTPLTTILWFYSLPGLYHCSPLIQYLYKQVFLLLEKDDFIAFNQSIQQFYINEANKKNKNNQSKRKTE